MEWGYFKFDAGYPEWVYFYRWRIIGTDSQEPVKYTLQGFDINDPEYEPLIIQYIPATKELFSNYKDGTI